MPGRPAYLWSLVEDDAGNVYAGTGPDGRILRFGAAGGARELHAAKEPLVTALALAPDGALLAATAPGGKILRLSREGGDAEVWSETGGQYVWDLAFADDGTLWAAGGEPGAILRIGRDGRATPLFRAEGAQFVRVLPDGGDVLAATSGDGRVYRVDRDGHGTVLHDDDLPEAADLLRAPDGTIWAAFLGPPGDESAGPSVTISLDEGDEGTPSASAPGSGDLGGLDRDERPVLRGTIEGLPSGDRAAGAAVRGRLVRIDGAGRAEAVWQVTGAGAFSLALDARGRVLFGTGEPARVYRVDDGRPTLLMTLPGAQANVLRASARRPLVGTSNPFGVYRFDGAGTSGGVFVSRPFDAGTLARWGTVRWTVDAAGSGRAELYTRTGNSAQPDATWSAWSPALTNAEGSPIINPDGRFLQWRVRLPGNVPEALAVRDVVVHYAPYNRPPQLKDLRLDGDEPAIRDRTKFRWTAYDPDDDAVRVRFEFRPRDGSSWSPLPIEAPPDAIFVDGPRRGWREDQLVWDAAEFPEGAYVVRAILSDRASNPPGEGFELPHDRTLELTVDRTPPEIELERSASGWTATVTDGGSDLREVHVLADDELVHSLRAVDGVTDTRRERYVFALDRALRPGAERWTLRAVDAAGNRVDVALESP